MNIVYFFILIVIINSAHSLQHRRPSLTCVLTFFKTNFFKKIFYKILSVCKMVVVSSAAKLAESEGMDQVTLDWADILVSKLFACNLKKIILSKQ